MDISFLLNEATQVLDDYGNLKRFAYKRAKHLATTANYLKSYGEEPHTYYAGTGTTYECDTDLFHEHTHHSVKIEKGVFTVYFHKWRGDEEDTVSVILSNKTITLPEEEWNALVESEKARIDAFVIARAAKRKEDSRKRDLEELQRLQKRLGMEVNT